MRDLALGLASITTLVGVWLCWRRADDRMQIEELAKDRRLTEEQARRKMGRVAWLGPVITFVGVALLCAVMSL